MWHISSSLLKRERRDAITDRLLILFSGTLIRLIFVLLLMKVTNVNMVMNTIPRGHIERRLWINVFESFEERLGSTTSPISLANVNYRSIVAPQITNLCKRIIIKM